MIPNGALNGALRPPREPTTEGPPHTRVAPISRVLVWIDQRVHASVALLVFTDLVAVAVALATAVQLPAAVLALACVLMFRVGFRLYRTRLRLAYGDDVGRALISTSIGFACATAGVIVVGEPLVREMAATVLVFLVVSEIGRAVVLAATRWARRAMKRGLRTVVVSSGDVGLDLFATMLAHPEFGLRPMDVIDPSRPPTRSAESDLDPSLADRSLADVIEEHCAQVVILAQDDTCSVPLVDAAIVADGLRCSVLVLPRAFEIHHDASDVERLRSYPLVRLRVDPTRQPSWLIKRLIDVVLSVVALVTLLPVLGLVALAVRAECGPVIFRQWRVGRAGQPFQLLKFTSLPAVNEVESATTWSVAGDPRIGPVGRFIRRTSSGRTPAAVERAPRRHEPRRPTS